MKRTRIALTGVGGFGRAHEAAALRLVEDGLAEIVAFAEPNDQNVTASALPARNIRRYRDYYEMLDAEKTLELVCIATPIPCHYGMAKAAITRGLHVFIEKPPVVQIQQLRELLALQENSGSICAVGFHDAARPSVIKLKRRLCEGAIGAVRAVRAHACWQRSDAYYQRADWAGKLRRGDDWVLDGPMNNACAHVLNLALYLASSELHEFARPIWVQAELYRAGICEGEDLDCLRAQTDSGVEVCIHLTQASPTARPRHWTILGENGVAELDDAEGVVLPGESVSMEEHCPPTETLLRRLVEVVQESDEPLLMPLAEAEAWLLLSNGAYESAGGVTPIPDAFRERVTLPDGPATIVPGLDDAIRAAVAEGKLLSECGVSWAKATERFSLADYAQFPARWTA